MADERNQTSLLTHEPAEDLGFAQIDHDRARRLGFPEVIYGAGKEAGEVVAIFKRLTARHDNVLCTRCDAQAARLALEQVPDAAYEARARVLYCRRRPTIALGKVAVVCAGTSDLPVALEAKVCAEVLGCEVELVVDVGVAGIHRLFAKLETIRSARVVICAAGMEAALPSVLGGLIDRPLIAVPTSVGYGASFGGLAALLGTLNSCAAGTLTVNIDNGFGAAYAAALMLR
jgi:NCAIR mutase (PurE)-related protein